MYGVIGAVSGMSAVLGPVVGGWLVTSDAFGIGWRSIFLINIPIGVALVVLAYAWVPETRSEHPLRLDPVGLVLATLGLFGVVWALVEGRQADWAPWVIGVGAAGLTVLGIFVVQQRRRERQTGSALLPESSSVSAVESVAADDGATDGSGALVVSPEPKIEAAYCAKIVGVALVSTA